jgi:hypothetical protein
MMILQLYYELRTKKHYDCRLVIEWNFILYLSRQLKVVPTENNQDVSVFCLCVDKNKIYADK